ncbi:hypothetical protein Btru_065443 [Bulinus truncatus]|nr:hypothetical protein Btru_065443 [Bulinus truncatus]
MVSNQKGRSDVVSKTAPFPALSDQKMKGNFRSLKPGSASSFSSRQSDQNYSLEKPKYTQFNNKPNVEQLIKNVTRQNNGIRINVMKFKHKEGFVRFKRSSRLALASNKKLLTKACIMLEFGQNGSVYNRVMSTSFGKECIAQALKLLNQRKLENADQNEKQKNMNDLFVLASRGGGRSRDFEVANEMYPINDPFHHNSLLNCLHLLNADTHFGLHKDMAIDRHGERLNDKTSLNSEDGENDIPYDAISNGEPRRLIDDDDDDSGFSPLRNLNAKNGNYNDVAVKPVVHLDPSEKYADDQSQEELSPVQDFIQTYKNILATKSARKPRTGIVSDRAEPSGLSNSVTYGFQKSDSDSGVNDDSIQFFESSSMGGGDQEIPDEKDVISKRPSFHSWSGKRSAQKNSLSKKPSFHSWSGKRSAPGNVQFKRPSFHSWSGKRHVPENAPLKRPSFHSWSGKRSINENFIAKKPSFHSWSGKRNARDKVSFKRPSFHSWSGKRNVNDITSFKTPSFHSWSGKRNGNENTNFKRPSFHSWSGKRDINEFLNYKRPSFHSWSG